MTDSVPATDAPSPATAAAPAAASEAAPASEQAAQRPEGGRRQGQGRGRPGRRVPGGNAAPNAAAPRPSRPQPPALLELAALYPRLFGEAPLPLKRGIFDDLMAAHPEQFEREALKLALGVHTRSTRYLQAVAAGQPRHDLQGQSVEPMAPEHVHHALWELYRRRQERGGDEWRAKIRTRMARAIDASGLTREDYCARVHIRDTQAQVLLDEALAELAAQHAREEALLRAFDASGQTVEAFADMYGMDPRTADRNLQRARQRVVA
ncbi:MAG: ProQ/FinO family protein [Giesbergeria sp.]